MSEYYVKTGAPQPGSTAASSLIRSEFSAIDAAFDKLPALAGNSGKAVVVNSAGTALIATTTLSNFTLVSPSITGAATVTAAISFTGDATATTRPFGSSGNFLATIDYVNNATLTTVLPGQLGNAGKVLQTNGTSASWVDLGGLELAPVAGGTLTKAPALYSFVASGPYTLPNLAGKTIALMTPSNVGGSFPASVTTSDGWSIATGFAAGTLSVIQPNSTFTPHGTWGSRVMTPPILASLTASAAVVSITGTCALSSTLHIVMVNVNNTASGFVAVNPVTNQVGALVEVTAATPGTRPVIYADTATTFVAGWGSTLIAGSVSGLTITMGTAQTQTVTQGWVRLTAGSYLSVNATNYFAATVSGTTVTIGAGVAHGGTGTDNAIIRIARVSNTTALSVYLSAGGGTATTRDLTARVLTVSGTAITPEAATNAGVNNLATNNTLNLLLPFIEGSSYLVMAQDGAQAATQRLHSVLVSGVTTSIGAQATVTASATPTLFQPETFVVPTLMTALRLSTTQAVVGGFATAAPFVVEISGSTLTTATTTFNAAARFMQSPFTQSSSYAATSNNLVRFSVTGATVNALETISAGSAVRHLFSDNVATNLNKDPATGVWYVWALLNGTTDRAYASLTTTSTAFVNSTSINITGAIT